MQRIHAMGVSTELMEQLELVMLLRQHVPEETEIKVIDDLEHHFGLNSTEYCWSFGIDCEEDFGKWIEQMKKDGYIFEGSTLLVDNGGLIAGIWANAEEVAPPEPEEAKEDGEVEDQNEVKATSELEIEASVILKGVDEEGKIQRFKVRGKYRRRRQQDVFSLIDVIDINKDEDLRKEDIEAVLAWVNECNINLLDYTIEGPGYTATQTDVHNFGVQRICLDQLHAIVLDRMISSLRERRNAIQVPQSATEMKSNGK